MMIISDKEKICINSADYSLIFEEENPLYVNLRFKNGIGAKLYIASGCDADEKIDELNHLSLPIVTEENDRILLTFKGKTTLWEQVEYSFECLENHLLYSYKVTGKGKLDNARFFEGFVKDDPRLESLYYPGYCGWGRHVSWHRPVKEFMLSSTPDFDLLFSTQISSSDKRYHMYYETTSIRVSGDRHCMGGDWLVTPPPYVYLMGTKAKQDWVSFGLVVKPGEYNFSEFIYSGGEGFGLDLIYDGYTEIDGTWESPGILFQAAKDEYFGIVEYCDFLRAEKLVTIPDYSQAPKWWFLPIFGGWGEQMFHSAHWEDYRKSESQSWSGTSPDLCTRKAYEKMLTALEEKGVNPTILIVDNRWFKEKDILSVDEKLWPDMKGFIAEQHKKGRKVILWNSPFSYCKSFSGDDVPVSEQMLAPPNEVYSLEIDTDVFYPVCKREKIKNRVETKYNAEHQIFLYHPDPLNPDYVKRVKEKIQYLLSPEGLDADGFEFDYTHYLPVRRGTYPLTPRNESQWGTELLHTMLKIYHDAAKKAKNDALLITHTFNPYFADVADMMRLQDIYTDKLSVVDQMHHRAKIARAALPECPIHTDQHPMPCKQAWHEYALFQPEIGNPCLYYVSGMETTYERFSEHDWEMLRKTWTEYEDAFNK